MDGNGEEIDGFSWIFSVQIAGADNFLRLGEDERIVRRRIDFHRDDVLHEFDDVVRDAMHLWQCHRFCPDPDVLLCCYESPTARGSDEKALEKVIVYELHGSLSFHGKISSPRVYAFR